MGHQARVALNHSGFTSTRNSSLTGLGEGAFVYLPLPELAAVASVLGKILRWKVIMVYMKNVDTLV